MGHTFITGLLLLSTWQLSSGQSINNEVCNLPADEGQGSGNIPNLYYDKARDNCQPLSYRGSGGNLNRFSNDKMCMRNCSSKAHVLYPETDAVCKMKNDKGFCQGFYYVFHYDWSKRTCDGFFYTGCGGNGNRFETKEMCNRTCGHLVDAPKDEEDEENKKNACNMNLDEGYGDGYFFRVYYNKTLDNCQPFSYRGSGGNLNKFITDKMCMRNCSSKGYEVYPESDKVCSMKVDPGFCQGRYLLFYYNSTKKACKTFSYTGCGGNGNRFVTKEICNETCGQFTDELNPEYDDDEEVNGVDLGLVFGIILILVGVAVFITVVVLAVKASKEEKKHKKTIQESEVQPCTQLEDKDIL
ncbi:BPTI/Kunitz domain-containing protein [Polypterus senegalus]|uniref:BPTI/Kunitz domain-containing protein n=1 Tax=Polypterus senegalus TaxID=55291 RepID=UPI001964CE82|nr:BPTI/Kunitz domain-containing protein [Polypterus senegalus]